MDGTFYKGALVNPLFVMVTEVCSGFLQLVYDDIFFQFGHYDNMIFENSYNSIKKILPVLLSVIYLMVTAKSAVMS